MTSNESPCNDSQWHWSSNCTLFPDPAVVRTTDRAAEDANSKGVEKLQRKKNFARSEAHPRKKIVKNVKKCGLQSRACLLALLVGEYLFEAFHWGIEVMRERVTITLTSMALLGATRMTLMALPRKSPGHPSLVMIQ